MGVRDEAKVKTSLPEVKLVNPRRILLVLLFSASTTSRALPCPVALRPVRKKRGRPLSGGVWGTVESATAKEGEVDGGDRADQAGLGAGREG